MKVSETPSEKYLRKQRARAAARAERSEKDREREALRRAAAGPAVRIDEAAVERKMEERRWMPDTPETEDEARRLNMGRKFNEFQDRETAVTRAIYRRMMKGKVAGERELRDPAEEEVSPAAREARKRLEAVERIKVEGGSYEVPGPEKGGLGL